MWVTAGRQVSFRDKGIGNAALRLGSTNVVEILFDDFLQQGSTVSYAASGGTAVTSGVSTDRDGAVQLRAGAAAEQYGFCYWGGAQFKTLLNDPWMIRARAKLSSATVAGTTRHLVGGAYGGLNMFAGIGAYGAGGTGGSNSKFTLFKGGVAGELVGGAQFAANLDTAAHDLELWYPGTGSLIFGLLDGVDQVALSMTGISTGGGAQGACTAHSGNQTASANGIDVLCYQILTVRP